MLNFPPASDLGVGKTFSHLAAIDEFSRMAIAIKERLPI
jgi:hypothetical protein